MEPRGRAHRTPWTTHAFDGTRSRGPHLCHHAFIPPSPCLSRGGSLVPRLLFSSLHPLNHSPVHFMPFSTNPGSRLTYKYVHYRVLVNFSTRRFPSLSTPFPRYRNHCFSQNICNCNFSLLYNTQHSPSSNRNFSYIRVHLVRFLATLFLLSVVHDRPVTLYL